MLTKNPALLDAEVNRIFIEAMTESASDSYVPSVATVRSTNKKTETGAIIGNAPKMGLLQQHDPYPFTPMIDSSVTATMEKYGAGVALHQDDWEDDQTGGFVERVMEMGDEAIRLPNALAMSALINGDTALGWDGVSFFNATHPVKQARAAWSNVISGAGTSAANLRAGVDAAVARFMSYYLLNGRPANPRITEVTVVAPTALRTNMVTALNPNANLTNSASLQGIRFNAIFDPDLDADDANDFYVLNVSYRIRPLILWERRAARVVAEVADSGANFDLDVRRYKSNWRGVFQYGLPERAIKITNT